MQSSRRPRTPIPPCSTATTAILKKHVDLLADAIADALTAEHLSYFVDRGSKTVKAYYCRVMYRAWGLTAHRGWACLMLDRRSLVQVPNAPRDQSQHPRARNDHDEETAYESYMNPKPDFQSGPRTLQTPIRWHPFC